MKLWYRVVETRLRREMLMLRIEQKEKRKA